MSDQDPMTTDDLAGRLTEMARSPNSTVEEAEHLYATIARLTAQDRVIAEMGSALEPFARDRLSDEPHVSDLVYRTASTEMRERAEAIDARDAAIRRARAALAGRDPQESSQ